jgi:hypothetical protein
MMESMEDYQTPNNREVGILWLNVRGRFGAPLVSASSVSESLPGAECIPFIAKCARSSRLAVAGANGSAGEL